MLFQNMSTPHESCRYFAQAQAIWYGTAVALGLFLHLLQLLLHFLCINRLSRCFRSTQDAYCMTLHSYLDASYEQHLKQVKLCKTCRALQQQLLTSCPSNAVMTRHGMMEGAPPGVP